MRLFYTILFIFFYINAFSQSIDYKKEVFSKNNFTLPYRILLPQSFNKSTSYPLLIFLHGAFEKGTDNERQLDIGGNFFLRKEKRDSFPAVIIFLQCPANDSWAYFDTELDSSTKKVEKLIFPFRRQPTPVSTSLMSLIDSLSHLSFVNNKQIYIAGLSQGGMGVLDLIARFPDVFAAGLSICGAGNLSTVKRFAGKVSLWLFHGSKDDVLPVYFSREFYKKLKKEKSDVKYSEYENVFHNCWFNAFKEPELLKWLFCKNKIKGS